MKAALRPLCAGAGMDGGVTAVASHVRKSTLRASWEWEPSARWLEAAVQRQEAFIRSGGEGDQRAHFDGEDIGQREARRRRLWMPAQIGMAVRDTARDGGGSRR